ncbi:MAG: WbqC family protein [Verrucomicrobiaceae bacterium]|nr:WbqC family protein [Verrucomicrobiaceae bacterium]
MTCVVLQPAYIPWRGLFDLIRRSDLFVFYDDVQYEKGGWGNRNRIKTANGPIWLTIPVETKGVVTEGVPIKDIRIQWTQDWARKHWSSISQAYAKAPHFRAMAPLMEPFYRRRDERLADFTIDTTIALSRLLGIGHTRFARSSDYQLEGAKTDRLVQLLKLVGATHYISGPSARAYIEPEKFAAAGIGLEYIDYAYREYPQLHPPYDPQVSIFDLLFMTGPDALKWITNEATS